MYRVYLILLFLLFLSSNPIVSQALENPNGNIKIGLLMPDPKASAAIHGSEIAIREANEKGGLRGHQFELVARSLEGPWGTGSKEAVSLIFEEKVWALLGSHNGRNAHIVEQAATKSSVVLISAWAGDPTLSQAFVPWFFNCVPNDDQQAGSLTKEIYGNRKFSKVIVVSCLDYDSKSATDCFLRSVKRTGNPEPVLFNYDIADMNAESLSERIRRTGAECVVLFCDPRASVNIAKQVRMKKMNLPLFGSLMVLDEDDLSSDEIMVYDNIISVPAGTWSSQENTSFRQKFRSTYKINPGMVASYSYDAMTILLEAIKNAGSNDRELIQKSLQKCSFQGVTGILKFDSKGNRLGEFETSGIKGGVPAGSE